MNMQEIEVFRDYLVKLPREKDGFPKVRWTGRAIAMGTKRFQRTAQRGQTRKIPMALEYKGYDFKTETKTRTLPGVYNYDTKQYEYPTEDYIVTVLDYSSEVTTRWYNCEYPINRILRLWDEYIEEKEIEEEIKRQQQEEREREQLERSRGNRERVEKVKEALDRLYPEHGITFEASEYGITVYGMNTRKIEWWEKLVEAIAVKQ